MYTHYYKIEQIRTTEKEDKSDVIYSILARLYFEENGETIGTQSLLTKIDTSDLSSFVPFNDLTEAKVISWVKKIHDPKVDDYYQQVLQINEQIKQQEKNKVIREKEFPWV